MPATLAQGTPNADIFGDVVFWLLILVAVAVVAIIAFVMLRNRLGAEASEMELAGFDFTLDDLRAMHAAGQLTDEEFELARRRKLAKARAELIGDDDADTG